MNARHFTENHFNSIQALRGIAAFFIMLEHIRFLNFGAFGVDIFFCISGFMALFSTEKRSDCFLRKRILRIVPLYYLITLFTYAVLLIFPDLFFHTRPNPLFLVKSLLFLPFDIGGGVLQPLFRIGWTINCEMFFYLLFFIAMKLSHKYRAVLCAGFLLLLAAVTALLPNPPAFLAFYGNPVMLEFLYGMICYYIVQKIYAQKKSTALSVCCALLSVCLFIWLLSSKYHIDLSGWRRTLFWGLPAAVIVLCFFVMELSWSFPSLMAGLGNISFSLYLIHYYPTQFLDRTVFHFDAFTPFTLFGAVVCIALNLCLAVVCWNLFEKRFSNLLRRRFLPQK